MTYRSGMAWAAACLALTLTTTSCLVGPKYVKPSIPATDSYREQLPPDFKEMKGWKIGEPRDDELKGNWWEIFGDPQLNALEEQVNVSNQTIAQDEAAFRGARALIQVTRAGYYPTVTGGVSVTGARSSTSFGSGVSTANLDLSGTASWVPDIWGQVRRAVESNTASAQASAALLGNAKLTMQADLALDYFQLRGLDQEKQLLDTNVIDYERALALTVNRYDQGVASQIDVAQAQTQLETTRSQATDTGIQRAQLEHAIAILIGKPPSELKIAEAPIGVQPPVIPVALPSVLLERRPDIAAAERQVAAANAQIGVAKAAFYPTLTLAATAGLEGSSLVNWFMLPSRFFSIGPSLVETVFDAGRRRAVTEQAQAAYDETVAAYRESVLTAFQQVEDNLAALRILEQESKEQAAAVTAAERSLTLANNQYQGGITTYLQVITAQTAALNSETTAVQLLTRRMTASVNLLEALGGGWNVDNLPAGNEVAAKPAPPGRSQSQQK